MGPAERSGAGETHTRLWPTITSPSLQSQCNPLVLGRWEDAHFTRASCFYRILARSCNRRVGGSHPSTGTSLFKRLRKTEPEQGLAVYRSVYGFRSVHVHKLGRRQ